MRLAVVASASPRSTASWSGIPYFATREIERRFADVTVIDTPQIDRLLVKAHKLARGSQLLREPAVVALYARYLDHAVRRTGADMVISIGAAHKVAALAERHRVIHVTDAMFDTIVGYYPKYEGLSARSLRLGRALQRRLVDNAGALLVASRWAARSAAAHYGLRPDSITVAPMGANLAIPPPPLPPRPRADAPTLLFVGYDWERKGGPLVLAILAALRARVPGARLHIAGCTPRAALGVPGVRCHGPLNKSDPRDRALFGSLFAESHFFCMPSRQEAYGLVYCEACAYSLPPVAADTGGIGEIIRDGDNGLLLPARASADDFAAAIAKIWHDETAYRAMQRAARHAFETRLNWRAWGDRLEEVLDLAGRPGAQGSAR